MTYRAKIGTETLELKGDTMPENGSASLVISGIETPVILSKLSKTHKNSDYVMLNIGGKNFRAEVISTPEGAEVKLADGRKFFVELSDEKQLLLESMGVKSSAKKSSGVIKSPMPGLVIKINVSVGDTVTQGQNVAILEAMKMQNDIKSPTAGVVKEINVKEKQAVEKNQALMKIE
ncbi:MAG: biotin/lipoyl-containing protein [Chloroherpetonaceae bacterium]|nr:biotin/lipoyl-containing protein [Chloroherpetonaceae bacterium]